jgi:putative ABC transport system ATP-binding protein/lipoprotein-releasing system ATP-binding protein
VNGEKVMNIFKTINQDMKTTVIMVTHDPDFAQLASRQIFLVDGLVSKGT